MNVNHSLQSAACALAAVAAPLLLHASLRDAHAEDLLPREQAARFVEREQPAQAPFDPSIVQRLRVPAGFEVNLYASGLGNVRMIDVAPDGTVYLTRRTEGDVLALRDTDGDGRADDRRTVVKLDGVHGLALRGGGAGTGGAVELLLSSSTIVWRLALPGGAPQVLIDGLPDGGQHPNRTVRVAPDGALWVSVGSSCNDCAEENQLERATLIRYAPDGSSRRIAASGLRNTIGYDWHPTTGALWGMDHGSDWRGDRLPPEELNRIVEGRHYGWPICFADRRVDTLTNAPPSRVAREPGQAKPPPDPITREQFCALTEPAVALWSAHAAPMALRFHPGTGLPPAMRHDAFVALRGSLEYLRPAASGRPRGGPSGSWNRGDPVGYGVLRLRFTPAGEFIGFAPFLEGFLDREGQRFHGRPTGLAIAADGAILVGDDTNGAIWRIHWLGGR
jgi:glucose/arabinose dehydrogenase